MTKAEIVEGNKLIAKFMDYSKSGTTNNHFMDMYRVKINGSNTFHTVETMPLNKSWDWLMPVVIKINSMSILEMDVSASRLKMKVKSSTYGIGDGKSISDVYTAVFEFIKYHYTYLENTPIKL